MRNRKGFISESVFFYHTFGLQQHRRANGSGIVVCLMIVVREGERRSAASSADSVLISECGISCVADVSEQPSRFQLRRRCGTAWTPAGDGSIGFFFRCVITEN